MVRTSIPQKKKPVAEMRRRARRTRRREEESNEAYRFRYDLGQDYSIQNIRMDHRWNREDYSRMTAKRQKANGVAIDKSASVDYADMDIIEEPTSFYHPDYGWMDDNRLDKVIFGFDPHRPLNRSYESERYSACKPAGKPVTVISTRGIFSATPIDKPRTKRLLDRDEYRERTLAGPIRRRRR